jgi:hypothetical protein
MVFRERKVTHYFSGKENKNCTDRSQSKRVDWPVNVVLLLIELALQHFSSHFKLNFLVSHSSLLQAGSQNINPKFLSRKLYSMLNYENWKGTGWFDKWRLWLDVLFLCEDVNQKNPVLMQWHNKLVSQRKRGKIQRRSISWNYFMLLRESCPSLFLIQNCKICLIRWLKLSTSVMKLIQLIFEWHLDINNVCPVSQNTPHLISSCAWVRWPHWQIYKMSDFPLFHWSSLKKKNEIIALFSIGIETEYNDNRHRKCF